MLLSQDQPSAITLKSLKGLLLCEENLTPEDRRLTEILDFLAIPWQPVTAGQLAHASAANHRSAVRFCILSSATYLARAIGDWPNSVNSLPHWMKGASSVFLYGFQDTPECKQLLRIVTGDAHAEIRHLTASQTPVSITSNQPELCGPMSGMQVIIEPGEGEIAFDVRQEAQDFQSIIRASAGELFLSTTRAGVRCYLSGGRTVTDIRSKQEKYFDVKKHFCESVPLLMYLKRAFREMCWNGSETSGCLVIDDPLLKPRYGFLRYQEALKLMDQHNFTTSIAFIPWNWHRTNPRAVDMFRNRPDRLSLCIHGSDHMGNEFASRSTARLNRGLKVAVQRMERLRQRTSLPYAQVMVFPRGAFSPEAGRALKLNGFVAAVNTEVAPTDLSENETTIANLWSMAILGYGTFPIYTRRYITHGIENFAFDGFLGKPCLIVGHHEAFKDEGRELVDFVDRLNSLRWNLRWRSLDDVVRRSYTVRKEANGAAAVQMFANNLVIENPSGESSEVTFLKEERDPDCVKAVTVNQRQVDFSFDGRSLCWNATLPPGATAEVRVEYLEEPASASPADGIGYNLKTRARRYLSEFRDNYLSQNNFLSESAARIKGFLK